MMTNSRMTNLGWPPLTNFSNHRIISVDTFVTFDMEGGLKCLIGLDLLLGNKSGTHVDICSCR